LAELLHLKKTVAKVQKKPARQKKLK